MDSAEEKLAAGQLNEALEDLKGAVRTSPSSTHLRIFLFQLLAVLGQWDKALAQLAVIGDLDASTLPMVQTYREALRCELLRAEVFGGRRAPVWFGSPDPWMASVTESLRLYGQGEYEQAGSVRDAAFEEAPEMPGSIDGEAFSWIADADMRLGPILEAIVNGQYYWIPVERLQRIEIEAPKDLRDVVWLPVHFTWANEGQAPGLIPTRYPGSENGPGSDIQLARRTDWEEHPGGYYQGLGQRMLVTETGEYALMDVRTVELAASASRPQEESTERGAR